MNPFKLFLLALIPSIGLAAGGGVPLDDMKPDMRDKASLQRGAKNFSNYCMGCHGLKFARYNRVARDLEIPEELMLSNLVFPDKRVGSLMSIAMTSEDAKTWFGAAPPDLTLVARVRGEDWLYTYLRSFYEDPKRPLGYNNLVFPNVGMPHVLADLQGRQLFGRAQKPIGIDPLTGQEVTEERDNVLYLAEAGQLTEKEYDGFVYDLVNFLVYMGEPVRAERESIGLWVLLFLAIFFIPAYMLNREYWREIH
jgi:ubiquinol-cytochrome c reductase cytochrome c1 subunit